MHKSRKTARSKNNQKDRSKLQTTNNKLKALEKIIKILQNFNDILKGSI